MERSLATIRRIDDINDIIFTNADGQPEVASAIVRATIGGWNMVTQRSNGFKPGDLVVYFEIDSVLPKDNPAFAFLEPYKYRLRTIKLKGQISQGLIMPLDILESFDSKIEISMFDTKVCTIYRKEVDGESTSIEIWEDIGKGFSESCPDPDGTDVTEFLGVTLYEPEIPAQLRGLVKGSFPGFLNKTDSERYQNLKGALQELAHLKWVAHEKLDGTSATFYLREDTFGVCSRNLELKESEDNTYWQLARELKLEENLRAHNYELAIQGEIIGPGIQKNPYQLKQKKLFVFDIYDIRQGKYLAHDDPKREVAMKVLNLESVPFVTMFTPLEYDKLQDLANRPSAIGPCKAEGVVLRPTCGYIDPVVGRVSVKAISNEYLLKVKD